MSRICQVTGKKRVFGNKVSNSNRKVKRSFSPNLHWKRFWSDKKKCFVRVFVSTKGLRIINKKGIDNVVLKEKNS